MVSLKTSKHRCQCFSVDYNSILFGLRREAPSTDRVLQERLLNVLSRAAAQKSRNPQELWSETVKPEWWSEVTDLPWKNPREHPKDRKSTLKDKIAILERELRKRNLISKELEEELKLQRDSKKVELELKSDFEAVITKASGLHYLLDKSYAKMTMTHIVSDKIATYARETRKCLQKCLNNLDNMCSKIEHQERRNNQLWSSMGLSKEHLLEKSDTFDILDSLPSLPSSSLSPPFLQIVSQGLKVNDSSAQDDEDCFQSQSRVQLRSVSPTETEAIIPRRRHSTDLLEEYDQDELRLKSRRTESPNLTSMRKMDDNEISIDMRRRQQPFRNVSSSLGLPHKHPPLPKGAKTGLVKYSHEQLLHDLTSDLRFPGRSKSVAMTNRELSFLDMPRDVQQIPSSLTISVDQFSDKSLFFPDISTPGRVTCGGLTKETGPSTTGSSSDAFSFGTLATKVTVDCGDVSDELEDVEDILEESDMPTITMYDAAYTKDMAMDELAELTRGVSVEDLPLSATVTEDVMYGLPAPRRTTVVDTQRQGHSHSTRGTATSTTTPATPDTDQSLSTAIESLSGYFQYHN